MYIAVCYHSVCTPIPSAALLSTHPVFFELSEYDWLSVQQLIEAQEDIVRSLDKMWFKDYVAYLNAKVKEVIRKVEEKQNKTPGKPNTVSIALLSVCILIILIAERNVDNICS